MIKIKDKKIHVSPDTKNYVYYLTLENDPVEYELTYSYSNSYFYKGVSATLSIVTGNFAKAIACKRLQSINRFTLNQVCKVFDYYNLNKPAGQILLNKLYYKELN